MISMGVDLASAALSAVSLAINGVPERSAVWKPDNKKDSDAVKLVGFERWLVARMFIWKPDIVVVEETVANFKSPKTPLQIAKREGVALLVAKKRKQVVVISAMITSSRSIVLSTPDRKAGNMGKEEAFDTFKKMYPNLKLLPKTVGGMDMADAYVHALAGPVHLERR